MPGCPFLKAMFGGGVDISEDDGPRLEASVGVDGAAVDAGGGAAKDMVPSEERGGGIVNAGGGTDRFMRGMFLGTASVDGIRVVLSCNGSVCGVRFSSSGRLL